LRPPSSGRTRQTSAPARRRRLRLMARPSPVAIVTGANRQPGIGFEIARALAQRMPEGTTVVVTARSPEMGEEAVNKLTSEGLNVIFHQLDIADAASVEALRTFVSDRSGGLGVRSSSCSS
ncbi:unnamed protein product, partial [Prorocentrum cordatum]